jgi:hypothetical protein
MVKAMRRGCCLLTLQCPRQSGGIGLRALRRLSVRQADGQLYLASGLSTITMVWNSGYRIWGQKQWWRYSDRRQPCMMWKITHLQRFIAQMSHDIAVSVGGIQFQNKTESRLLGHCWQSNRYECHWHCFLSMLHSKRKRTLTFTFETLVTKGNYNKVEALKYFYSNKQGGDKKSMGCNWK